MDFGDIFDFLGSNNDTIQGLMSIYGIYDSVTNADKAGNTPAYQRMKAGDKRYKAADHMGEDVEVEEGYKELSRDKRNTMFRKAGNLARTA